MCAESHPLGGYGGMLPPGDSEVDLVGSGPPRD